MGGEGGSGSGGLGGYGASGSGNAGGGGGASRIDGTYGGRDGGDASGATPGNGGTAVEPGETPGFAGSIPIGSVGGAGGKGASATHTSPATAADSVTVYGGHGGRGGQGGMAPGSDGGNGGDGGAASLTLSGNMDVSGDVNVYSGQGGNGARAPVGSGASGTGGRGGDASLGINGALSATNLAVVGGGNGGSDGDGALNPGAGSDVGFFATSLVAGTIDLQKYTGSRLAFNVGTLDVTGGGTTLYLVQTAEGTAGTAMGNDGVYIGTARLGDGQLQVLGSGAALINTLQLEGRGTFYESTSTPVTLGNLAINGGTLHWGNWNIIEHAYTTPAITLGANGATVELNTGEYLTLSRNLIGTGSLTKTGAGNLKLNAANTYTGLTTVQAGTLDVSSGSITHSSGLELYGGSAFIPNTGHTLDNKTLTVRGENANYQGNLSAQNATLNFIAPVTISQPLLNVTGNADVSNSVVNVGVSGGTSLPMGTQLQLLNVTGTLSGAETLTEGSGIVESGVTTLYGLTLAVDPATGNLVGAITSGNATEKSKSLSEGYLSSTAFLTQASDFLTRRGVSAAQEEVKNARQTQGSEFSAFIALGGGKVRNETGSSISVSGYHLIAGLASAQKLNNSELTLAGFIEYGEGDYTSHNSYNSGKIKGKGDTRYKGIGLLARNEYPSGLYLDASLRIGQTDTDFKADLGQQTKFDTRSTYTGAHLGIGKNWTLNETGTLDTYGQILYTRQQSDSVTLSTGEKVKFDAIDSERIRIGTRYQHKLTNAFTGYAGIAYDHEFGGKAKAKTNGYKIDAPSLKGGSGMFEIGLTGKPAANKPLFLDLGIQGYAGKREGVMGSLRVNYRF